MSSCTQQEALLCSATPIPPSGAPLGASTLGRAGLVVLALGVTALIAWPAALIAASHAHAPLVL